jgi:hypothetical protein
LGIHVLALMVAASFSGFFKLEKIQRTAGNSSLKRKYEFYSEQE